MTTLASPKSPQRMPQHEGIWRNDKPLVPISGIRIGGEHAKYTLAARLKELFGSPVTEKSGPDCALTMLQCTPWLAKDSTGKVPDGSFPVYRVTKGVGREVAFFPEASREAVALILSQSREVLELAGVPLENGGQRCRYRAESSVAHRIRAWLDGRKS